MAPETLFDLQGHRGARGRRPENTLAAFAHALSIGVTTPELDTAVTRDRRGRDQSRFRVEPSPIIPAQ